MRSGFCFSIYYTVKVIIMKQNLANGIHLVVLKFFQDRRGFDEWWHSMDSITQDAIEQNLIDCIDHHLNKTVEPTLTCSGIFPHTGSYGVCPVCQSDKE